MLGKVGLGIQKNPIFLNNFWNSRYSWSENFTFPIPPPEKAMATHSSMLAWKIPWMEEPVRLQPMGSQRVGHDWATSFSLFTFMHWRRKWQPTLVFLPGESHGQRSLVGCSSRGRKELDTTEQLHFHFSILQICLGMVSLRRACVNFFLSLTIHRWTGSWTKAFWFNIQAEG